MRKSTAIPLALFLLCPSLHADEGAKDQNPLVLLPGMSPLPRTTLPASSVSMPQEVISQVTNYPNPFDSRKPGLEGETAIAYSLAQDAKVSMVLYDLLGRRVREWSFPSGDMGGRLGSNQVLWDGTNETGQKVSKGGYIAEIQVETSSTTATVIRKIGVIH